jgi:hypothetical protein
LAQLFLGDQVGGAMKVGCQLLHGGEVGLLGSSGQATQLHVFKHALA